LFLLYDVQLFTRYTWFWDDERHPDEDDPSVAFYPTLTGEIASGGTLPFRFTPSPSLPRRSDGKFIGPSVTVAGFAQVIPQAVN
jgi:hypothetical protein